MRIGATIKPIGNRVAPRATLGSAVETVLHKRTKSSVAEDLSFEMRGE